MKLTTILYLHRVFHLAKDSGVTQGAYESGNKKPLIMSQKIRFSALNFYELLDCVKNRKVCDELPW